MNAWRESAPRKQNNVEGTVYFKGWSVHLYTGHGSRFFTCFPKLGPSFAMAESLATIFGHSAVTFFDSPMSLTRL
jgi:hypothetical protein